jgi:hypothetical protein
MSVVETDETTKARTEYQLLLETLLVPLVPLRRPRARGKPTAATGLRGMARRMLGMWIDMLDVALNGRAFLLVPNGE